MKILFIGRQFHPCIGGTETMMLEYATRLIKKGHPVSILTLNQDLFHKKSLSSYEEYKGIKIFRISYLSFFKKPIPLCNPLMLFHIFRSCDVIHTHDIRFLLETSLFFKFLMKKVLVVGSYGFILHQKSFYFLKQLIFKYYFKNFFKLADVILAISHQDYEKLSDRFSSPRLELAEGGVDFQKYASVKRKAKNGRLLFFGRLDKHKGIDLLFNVLTRVKGDWYLNIIYGSSSSDYEGHLKKMSLDLKLTQRISWIGRCSDEDLLNYLGQSQFIVLPSRYEGFGLTTVEAMAAGVIPIANDIDAFRNIIEDGQTGFIVNFEKTEDAAQKLDQCFACDVVSLEKISAVAQAKAKTYDWENKVNQLVKLYEQLVH